MYEMTGLASSGQSEGLLWAEGGEVAKKGFMTHPGISLSPGRPCPRLQTDKSPLLPSSSQFLPLFSAPPSLVHPSAL